MTSYLMKVLHLTLKRKWFDAIASGMKGVEFRARSSYWDKRLLGREYDEVHFRNGYTLDRPFMRVEFKEIVSERYFHNIILGKVIEVKYEPDAMYKGR